MSKAEITVLYFASASTATGLASESISIPSHQIVSEPATPLSNPEDDGAFRLSSLGPLLVARHPNLEEILRSSRWSVDAEMINQPEHVVLKGGEEVAIICPVSGG